MTCAMIQRLEFYSPTYLRRSTHLLGNEIFLRTFWTHFSSMIDQEQMICWTFRQLPQLLNLSIVHESSLTSMCVECTIQGACRIGPAFVCCICINNIWIEFLPSNFWHPQQQVFCPMNFSKMKDRSKRIWAQSFSPSHQTSLTYICVWLCVPGTIMICFLQLSYYSVCDFRFRFKSFWFASQFEVVQEFHGFEANISQCSQNLPAGESGIWTVWQSDDS